MERTRTLALAAMSVAAMLTIVSVAVAIVYEQWDHHTPGPGHCVLNPCGVGMDVAGNVYTAGSIDRYGGYKYYVNKFDPDGRLVWNYYWSGGRQAQAMAVDARGNTYVTGIGVSAGSEVYATLKCNSAGQLQWGAFYNGPGNYHDQPSAIALDETGNVYVTGKSANGDYPNYNYDYLTIKYNPLGTQIWTARFNGPANGDDVPVAVAVDGAGNVYVTGSAHGNNGDTDYATVKYDSTGHQLWEAWYYRNRQDNPVALGVDQAGNVYVTGTSGSYDTNDDIATVKYNSNGALLWVALYANIPWTDGSAANLALDADGNVIVLGLGDYDHNLTLKYSPNGSLLWIRQYDPVIGYTAFSRAVTVDHNRNIFITGTGWASGWVGDCVTWKYNPQGALQWAAGLGEIQDYEEGEHIVVDENGNVVVAGTFCAQLDPNFLLLKYHQPTGDFTATMTPTVTPVLIPAQGGSFSYTLQTFNSVQNNLATDFWWKVLYPDSSVVIPLPGLLQMALPLNNASYPRTQRVPGNLPAGTYQYILYAGISPDIIWACDTLSFVKLSTGNGPLVKSSWSLDEREPGEENWEQIAKFGLSTNPNPFNSSEAISYQLSAYNHVSLQVYDISGRLVQTLVDGWKEAGLHKVTFDGTRLASGLYLIRMQAGEFTAVQKVMLVK